MKLFSRIVDLIEQSRKRVAATFNSEMVLLYWNIGKIIKEEIIKSERAEYGKQIVENLSERLMRNYGRGFSPQNLWYMIQLYEAYPIRQSLLGEFEGLTWTHIISLLSIKISLNENSMQLCA